MCVCPMGSPCSTQQVSQFHPVLTTGVSVPDMASKRSQQSGAAGSGSGAGPGMRLLQPVVVAGPSGSGKSTLLRLLFREFPDSFGLSVSRELATCQQQNGERL